MANEPIYAVIDIGTSKIISIAARLGNEGELKPLGVGSAPALGVQQGVIDDFSEVREAVQASLNECLRYVGRNPVNRFYAIVNGDHLVGANASEGIGGGEELLTVTDQHLKSLLAGASGLLQQQLDGNNEQTLHIIPMRYRLDGMASVRNPTGLHTSELQMEAHVVRGKAVPVGNTVRVLQSCKVQIEGMIAHPLASAEGVSTADEREMGVGVIDIGGGTIKIALYRDGTPFYSSVVGMGGNHLTRDLAVALRVPYRIAEELKIQHGHALPDELSPAEEVIIPATQMHAKRIIRRRELCDPLYQRSLQMLKLIHNELCNAEMETAPAAGFTLTGGGALMPGFAEMTERGLRSPVRLGLPVWYAGLPESLRRPEYAAALGALQWAVRHRSMSDRARSMPDRSGGRRPQAPVETEAKERRWSPRSVLRRPFARAGANKSNAG